MIAPPGAALASDGVDATAICTDVGACTDSSDSIFRERKQASLTWETLFCQTKCALVPQGCNVDACVTSLNNGAISLANAVNQKVRQRASFAPCGFASQQPARTLAQRSLACTTRSRAGCLSPRDLRSLVIRPWCRDRVCIMMVLVGRRVAAMHSTSAHRIIPHPL
jgi:hypothetical protein